MKKSNLLLLIGGTLFANPVFAEEAAESSGGGVFGSESGWYPLLHVSLSVLQSL